MVVETAGFNDRSWLDIEGHPHTEALRIIERFRRRDVGHMELEMTIDDPKAFTRPFSFKIAKTLTPDTDLLESVCENDTSKPHMLGGTEITRLAPEILARYTGDYEFAPGRTALISSALISLDGELLFLQEGADPLKLPLVPTSETNFGSRTNGDRIDFLRDADGSVTGFTLSGSGQIRRALRKKQGERAR